VFLFDNRCQQVAKIAKNMRTILRRDFVIHWRKPKVGAGGTATCGFSLRLR
jgi:hypothetical protein